MDWYLFRRYSSGNPLTLPSLPDQWIFLAFPLLILIPGGVIFFRFLSTTKPVSEE